ncbi:MAG: phosphoenolpyruvate synthase [Ignavibacteria bacterium]|nr:phosphoenolpyruvate synthase [Ignavibacteria bacterium]
MANRKKNWNQKTISFPEKYKHFQELLNYNEDAHNAMSNLSEVLASGKPFSSEFALNQLDLLFDKTLNMTRRLINQVGEVFSPLIDKLNELKIASELALIPTIKCPDDLTCPNTICEDCEKVKYLLNKTPFFFNLNEVTDCNTIQVGNKMAHLGEVKNILGIPVPDGFCLSVRLLEDILRKANARNKKKYLFKKVDFSDTRRVLYVSRQVQALIIATQIPEYIENAILKGFDNIFGNRNVHLAVRSSALGEDSEKYSFAGLYSSILNITKEYLIDAVLEVLISLYSPQSVTYRFLSGMRDEDIPMCVGCLEMVDAKSGGVIYTKDPNQLIDGMLIQSVWGLGVPVVEGTVKPQQYIVTNINEHIKILYTLENGEFIEISDKISIDKTNDKFTGLYDKPNLLTDEINILYNYAKKIEEHYHKPQDIEWAVGKNGIVYILQTRPLKITKPFEIKDENKIFIEELDRKYNILIKKGDCCSSGVGFGKVIQIKTIRDIAKIKEGSVVVARKNLIELTSAMQKMSALVTDVGSTTGHLSIIAREMNVPLLTNVMNASSVLTDGTDVTVIAHESRVYEGTVREINLEEKFDINKRSQFMISPLYTIWSNLTKYLFNLNLVDSESSNFNLDNCHTIHDIIRYVHEMSIRAMFKFNPDENLEQLKTYKLKFDVPIDLYIIDLGKGIKEIGSNILMINDILSKPLLSLITGMTTPGITWSGFVSLDGKGFADMILGNIGDPNVQNVSLNQKSYALISDKYLNFFSQLGYHFSRLDSFASDQINTNYINFNFKGGAANMLRKSRRIEVISKILEALDFDTYCKEDSMTAKIRNIPKERVYNLISELGKLMGAVRNTDVIMLSDEHVSLFVEAFLNGESSPAQRIIQN